MNEHNNLMIAVSFSKKITSQVGTLIITIYTQYIIGTIHNIIISLYINLIYYLPTFVKINMKLIVLLL